MSADEEARFVTRWLGYLFDKTTQKKTNYKPMKQIQQKLNIPKIQRIKNVFKINENWLLIAGTKETNNINIQTADKIRDVKTDFSDGIHSDLENVRKYIKQQSSQGKKVEYNTLLNTKNLK